MSGASAYLIYIYIIFVVAVVVVVVVPVSDRSAAEFRLSVD